MSNKENKVKPIARQSSKKAAFTPLERKPHLLGVVKKRGGGLESHRSFLTGFTIVELLTVMSIIVILITLLVPSLNMAKRFATKVKQRNQFHSIDVALEIFHAEHDGYPDSDELDEAGVPYCGALRLCEAMLGQDLLGFHPDSRFRADGMGGVPPVDLYPPNPFTANLRARDGLYLKLEEANAYKLKNLYGTGATAPFNEEIFVLCDVYRRVRNIQTGRGVGMPVLYYKANTSKTAHDLGNPDNLENIYDYKDNIDLVMLGKPWDPTGTPPPLSRPLRFYEITLNDKITAMDRSYRSDSFILISAGFDGEYGTRDDIFNFPD